MPFLIVLVILVGLAFYLLSIYNGLAKLKVRVEEAWSGIEVQLKRRTDLIPNLVETVKGYAKHEKEVFENVTAARSALVNAGDPAQAQEANNMLTGALKSLFAIAEAYPDLKASENFKQLQADLTDTEDKIAYARQFYNANVRDYNTKIVVFPNSIIAGMFNFTPEKFFDAPESELQPVKVDFGTQEAEKSA